MLLRSCLLSEFLCVDRCDPKEGSKFVLGQHERLGTRDYAHSSPDVRPRKFFPTTTLSIGSGSIIVPNDARNIPVDLDSDYDPDRDPDRDEDNCEERSRREPAPENLPGPVDADSKTFVSDSVSLEGISTPSSDVDEELILLPSFETSLSSAAHIGGSVDWIAFADSSPPLDDNSGAPPEVDWFSSGLKPDQNPGISLSNFGDSIGIAFTALSPRSSPSVKTISTLKAKAQQNEKNADNFEFPLFENES